MSYEYLKKAGNIYLIDTQMFGFDRFQSSYLVAGRELALIDAGVSTSLEVVRAEIQNHGFAIEDIAYIFVTHAEHPDHSGNVGALLKENRRARVYVAPTGLEYLTNPEVEAAIRKANLSPQMAARFGEMVPVPRSRIQLLKEGDSFNLGDGERLSIMMTPGHQPSGIVILEEKNSGLFINDLCGAYFADAGASFIFTPFRADVKQYLASLKRVVTMPLEKLYLGHFGICDKPQEILRNAIEKVNHLVDIATEYKGQYDPGELYRKVLSIRMQEAEKLRSARGEKLYEYLSQELMPSMSRAFTDYCLENQKKRRFP
jgi:glyoxylase-like metal-dependent hydrolase (beta-lactamase superfamily II)